MKEPTRRQAEILGFLKSYRNGHKYPPTIREVAEHFGISVKGAYDHVKALEKKGMISCASNRSRAIEIIEPHGDGEEEDRRVSVPLLGHVAAGDPLFAEENREGKLDLPENLVGKGRVFALRVEGDSMIGAGIMDGDIAVITQQQTAENGQIVVAAVNEAFTLKRFYKEKHRIKLQAENPAYAPIYTTDARIAGRLKAIIRPY